MKKRPPDESRLRTPAGVASLAVFASEGDSGPYLVEQLELSGQVPQMRGLLDTIREVAKTDATVLVRGESGVGKNVVARAIHASSERRSGPFTLVNCAALPGELLESELFGHEKGAFTGAYRRKPGRFEFAAGGTLCLDEIGEIPRPLQAKLLHVLQDLQFSRVGGRELIRADVRVIATTNRDLQVAMRSGEFREDLYYRLNVVEIHVPPLRERPEAISSLARSFLVRYNAQYLRDVTLLPETVALMTTYLWPGNVRELENFIRRLVVLGDSQRAHGRSRSAPGHSGTQLRTCPGEHRERYPPGRSVRSQGDRALRGSRSGACGPHRGTRARPLEPHGCRQDPQGLLQDTAQQADRVRDRRPKDAAPCLNGLLCTSTPAEPTRPEIKWTLVTVAALG
jgi:transcriptional regulator with GAF, ATPase, and Fis domain